MKIKVEKEQYDDIVNGLNNALYTNEEWTPEKGFLFIKCGEDQVIADVMECERAGQGRWLIIFSPIGVAPRMLSDKPVSEALEEVEEPKIPQKPKSDMRKFLNSITKPWNGYNV
jgi:hypothetical protein